MTGAPVTPETGAGNSSISHAASVIEGLLGPGDGSSEQPERKPAKQPAKAEAEPATQPEEAEAEAESQTSEGEPQEATQDAEPEQPEVYEVTLPGGEKVKVTLDELRRGYSREQDYTRKTMELAEKRKASDAERQAAAQSRQQLDSVLALHVSELERLIPSEQQVDWARLQKEDPAEFVRLKEYFRDLKDQRQIAQQRRQELFQKQADEHQQALAARAQEEAVRLKAKLPAFEKPETRAELRQYLINEGFSPEEVGGVIDHRVILTAWKAAQYDKLQKAKPNVQKSVANLPKVQKPGAATDASQVSYQQITADKEKLRKSGSIKDAAKLFERLLE